MNQIDTISDDANQLLTVVLDDGSQVQITLQYLAAVQRWAMSIASAQLNVNGINVCTYPNLLRPWINLIDFGIQCASTDGGDPVFQDDFSTGRCALYVLNQEDVAAAEAAIRAS